MKCVFLLVTLGLWFGAIGVAFAEPEGNEPFTAEERERLGQGGLVARKMSTRRGSLQLLGGASWQVIRLRPSEVWRALCDTRHYSRMLPRVVEARLVATKGKDRFVYFRQDAGPVDVEYVLRLSFSPNERDVRFALDETRPHSIRAAWGFFALRPHRNGETVLSYGIMADIGSGLLRSLIAPVIHTWMLRVPMTIRWFVEGSGKGLYQTESPPIRAVDSSAKMP